MHSLRNMLGRVLTRQMRRLLKGSAPISSRKNWHLRRLPHLLHVELTPRRVLYSYKVTWQPILSWCGSCRAWPRWVGWTRWSSSKRRRRARATWRQVSRSTPTQSLWPLILCATALTWCPWARTRLNTSSLPKIYLRGSIDCSVVIFFQCQTNSHLKRHHGSITEWWVCKMQLRRWARVTLQKRHVLTLLMILKW